MRAEASGMDDDRDEGVLDEEGEAVLGDEPAPRHLVDEERASRRHVGDIDFESEGSE